MFVYINYSESRRQKLIATLKNNKTKHNNKST